jgi:hypothetical protein
MRLSAGMADRGCADSRDGCFHGKHGGFAAAGGLAEVCIYLMGGAAEARRFAAADWAGVSTSSSEFADSTGAHGGSMLAFTPVCWYQSRDAVPICRGRP